MKTLLRLGALAACALWATTALAQSESASLPSGDGTLRGRVVRRDDGELAGLRVVVYALPEDGNPGLGRGFTDESGGFSFEGVSNDPSTVYLVGVRANDLPFGSRVRFAPGQRELEVTLEVAASSTEGGKAHLESLSLRFDRGCEGLRISEVHELRNDTDQVIVVPDELRGERTPLFALELPASAGPLAIPFGVSGQGLVQEGRYVAFYGPLYPGLHQVEFAYSVRAEPGPFSFTRPLPIGAGQVEVLTHANGPVPTGPAFDTRPDRPIEGRPYERRVTDAFAPGQALDLTLEIPPVEAPPLEITRAQLWFELDDAALVVSEQYGLETSVDAPLTSTSEAPLLCLALPAGAEALRFSSSTLAMGLTPDPSGKLALHGPVPPGRSVAVLSYRLPVNGPSIEFTHRYPRSFPLLSVFVADTGVVAETERLHRRRPVRREDRTYLHLEAFQIAPDEPVAIRFERLVPRTGPPRLALTGAVLLAVVGAVGFLATPLRRHSEELTGETERERIASERESVYASIRDLDEDFETGKLTPEDHDQMRAELRAQAVALLQRERVATQAPQTAETAELTCPACGAQLATDARFCHRCGGALAAPDRG